MSKPAFKVVPMADHNEDPKLIVSWPQYRHMVKIGMISRETATEYLPAEEVDALINGTAMVSPALPPTPKLKVVRTETEFFTVEEKKVT